MQNQINPIATLNYSETDVSPKNHYFKQIYDQAFVTSVGKAYHNLHFFVNNFTYDLLKCTVDVLKHTNVLI